MKTEEILAQLIQSAQNAKDFVVEQAPDVIQQLLAWHFWSSVIWATICFAAVVGIVFAFKTILRHIDEFEGQVFVGFLGIICSVPFLVGLIYNVGTALQIAIAPKLYLLEYAASLMK